MDIHVTVMHLIKPILGNAFISVCLLLACHCSGGEKISPELILVASTPGDEAMKSMLAIPVATKVDFIRWHLTLGEMRTNATEDTFSLNIIYGEGEPGTPGFKNGGEKREIRGSYSITKSNDQKLHGALYHLKSFQLPGEIAFVKLNENLYHLLTSSAELMIGNGGWSYSLNRKVPVKEARPLPLLTNTSNIFSDTSRQVIYDGRTPCQTFASDHLMKASSECFKLKWRLVLNRDPVTHAPTTYKMRKVVDNAFKDVTGSWSITKGVPGNSKVLIIRIDPGKGKETISLLVGDSNVLFLLDTEDKLYAGNGDWSYTLNKKP
jgi:hypothetical protein